MKDEQFKLLMKSVNEMKDLLKDMKRQKELEDKWNSISYEGVETSPDKYIMTTCEEKQL